MYPHSQYNHLSTHEVSTLHCLSVYPYLSIFVYLFICIPICLFIYPNKRKAGNNAANHVARRPHIFMFICKFIRHAHECYHCNHFLWMRHLHVQCSEAKDKLRKRRACTTMELPAERRQQLERLAMIQKSVGVSLTVGKADLIRQQGQ